MKRPVIRQWKRPTSKVTFGLNGQTFTVDTKKRSKYRNTRVLLEGIWFDSQREARRWFDLKILERHGQIRDLVLQPTFILAPSVRIEGEARKRPAMRYTADFAYTDVKEGEYVVEDVKSAPTAKAADFRMRQHLMATVHGISVRVIL